MDAQLRHRKQTPKPRNSDSIIHHWAVYPGANPGRLDIRVERLRPGSKYAMRNGSEHAFAADNSGAASLTVELNGRTPIHIVPAN